jgi:hypothetical protein
MKRFKEPKLRPPRPENVVIPEGFPVTRCPPGTARGATDNLNWNKYRTNPSYSGPGRPEPRRLFRVSVVCECGQQNELMLTKAKLKNIKAVRLAASRSARGGPV